MIPWIHFFCITLRFTHTHTHDNNICLHLFQEGLFFPALLGLQLDPLDQEDPGGKEESAQNQDLVKVKSCMMLLRNWTLAVHLQNYVYLASTECANNSRANLMYNRVLESRKILVSGKFSLVENVPNVVGLYHGVSFSYCCWWQWKPWVNNVGGGLRTHSGITAPPGHSHWPTFSVYTKIVGTKILEWKFFSSYTQ